MEVDCECVVIGAGVVGLAIAAKLAQLGREVIILEGEADYGSITSARNSEVIHAGIYYAKDSLKAKLCVQGKQQLYAYCRDRKIPFSQCGKLIVAADAEQLSKLSQIKARAIANGVDDLSQLTAAQAQELEPQLACTGALLSPSTGIVDSHAFMVSLLGDAENHGAVLVPRTRVVSMRHVDEVGCYELQTLPEDATGPKHTDRQVRTTEQMQAEKNEKNTQEKSALTAKYVINAAGHGACDLVNSLQSSRQHLPKNDVMGNAADELTLDAMGNVMNAVMFKGNYFSLAAPSPFSRLVYPVPEEAGLGVHLTIDLAGRARFGPDVEPVDTENYVVDPCRAERFYAAIRRYWPALPDESLLPDYSGIRPRVQVNGDLYPDFLIQGPLQHGLPGLVNLLSIESPGLTASLAIADEVATMLWHD